MSTQIPMHSKLSCFCSVHTLVIIVGHHQNYYNLAQQQRNELEAPPRTRLSDHIYSEQPYHSNYSIDRRGPKAGELTAAATGQGASSLF